MSQYRGLNLPEPGLYPFWFWNGVQNEPEIQRQLRLFRDNDCKGVLIHSRSGNKIPYLSDRWLELVRFTCGEAEKLGLKIWIYDEDGYPSGNAGRQVQTRNPELVQKYLAFEYGVTDPGHPAFAVFSPENWKMLEETAVPAGTPVLKFHRKTADHHVDTFNPESARSFLELTHEKYEAVLAPYFGNVIEAFYTDDESFECCCLDGFPWSEYLEKAYCETWHEDLRPLLPLLVEDLPGCEEVRRRFYAQASALFLKNFIQPQRDWVEQRGMIYTGHLCCDEGPMNAMVKAFCEPMDYLHLETIPAIDDYLCDMQDCAYLRRSFYTGFNAFNNLKFKRAPLLLYKPAASIAHQFAKGMFSAEVLTFLSWRCAPEFMDEQMLFETALGVNLITPHAFYYTLGDGTKYDCPPSYFYQQPYSPLAHAMHRKWTRIAELMQRGKACAETLLIYPAAITASETGTMIDQSFVMKTPQSTPDLVQFEAGLADLVRNLYRRHVSFDFGSEPILLREAKLGEGTLTLGDMTYSTILLPPMIDVLPGTKALLERFQKSGGRVITSGEADSLTPDLQISGDFTQEILVSSWKTAEGCTEYNLVNLSGRDLSPEIQFPGEYSLYDPAVGKILFTGNSLPENFVFPDGSSFLLLSPSFSAEKAPLSASRFAPFHTRIHPELRSIRPLNDNAYAIPRTPKTEFFCEDGASVHAVYADALTRSALSINQKKVPMIPDFPAHPADPCFQGTPLTDQVAPGLNRMTLEPDVDMLYLTGDFRVRAKTLCAPELPPLKLGDLAIQGYPFYWGAMEYEFAFEGKANRMKADFRNGIMEVFVNGKSCGILYGKPGILPLGNEVCGDGSNALRIVFRNTAENWMTATPSAFGVQSIVLD